MGESFLELLYGGASREAFDRVVVGAEEAGADEETLARLRQERELALRLRETMARQRAREAELAALYETATDLTAIRDVDEILAAIVHRARQMLNADMTYLSLNDEAEGASYMKVTDGALTPEFRNLRLPLGTGLLGLVAQTGAPYFTEDYQGDDRFVHRDYIDAAVAGERIRAILGVPLIVEGRVIGALLAVHRTVRRFPPEEVSLLTSLAAHAAIALENARLFEQTQNALAEVDEVNRQIRAHSETVERAANAHDRLTDVLLLGGGVEQVAEVLADILRGRLTVLEPDGVTLVAGAEPPAGLELAEPIVTARRSGRSAPLPNEDGYVAAALAGTEHLATLVLHGLAEPLGLAELRTLERGALVTALVLLFRRTVSDAEGRVRGELLADLITGADGDEARLRERARRQYADLDAGGVVAVARIAGLERHRATQVASRLAAGGHGLAGEYDGCVVLCLPDPDVAGVGTRLRDRVRAAGGEATVGVVASRPGPAGVATAYHEARRCLDALVALGREGEVADPAGLGLTRLLLGHNGPAELEDFIDRALGPLVAYDDRRGTDLVGTLEAWFASGGHLRAAADALHVHPNTVAQRLDRVGELLGADWREPARALDLQLALRVARLRRV